jgi:hypothetical protein
MTSGIFGSGLRIQPAVKRKIFVSYHHRGDQGHYDIFSRTFHDTYDVITDNPLERKIDSDDVDYVKRRISENNITGSSCTIVLVGANTWGRKHVDWEIKATLDKQHGLIGVQLPTLIAGSNGTVPVAARSFARALGRAATRGRDYLSDLDRRRAPRGRDAADIPMITTFGSHRLTRFAVVTEEIKECEIVVA